MRLQRPQKIALGVSAFIVIVMGWGLLRYAEATRVKVAQLGSIAPNILATAVTGQSFQLTTLRGKPVLLNFFTPWCPPCVEEMPALAKFAVQHASTVQVVMIDRADDPALVRAFVQKNHIPHNITVLLSPRDEWSEPYGVTGQPETFWIGPQGKIQKHVLGPLTNAQLNSLGMS
jgi:cytochrome c biogenesis protein CcmG/thiol:disulfide interchange protein DsbE